MELPWLRPSCIELLMLFLILSGLFILLLMLRLGRLRLGFLRRKILLLLHL